MRKSSWLTMRVEYMTPLTNARSQFFLATCLSPGKCKQLRPEQHLPTSISYTKLEIATYIHELADKLHPSTTSQYILLGTTQLAPNTTLHYKTCKNYFPVLLCTTKLARSTPQYYFVLQSLHKVVPSMLQFAAPKPDVDAKAEKRRFWTTFSKEF